ncbi:hypothetical protein J3Q64DRAFT_1698937 [Phycomyces blakesleeanus]|uniref:F-box domain-containing protein n=1 Tax=Phycomyces blakesleeanus TaxID=4837 RepID=A0ABR3B1Z6_PHYBL
MSLDLSHKILSGIADFLSFDEKINGKKVKRLISDKRLKIEAHDRDSLQVMFPNIHRIPITYPHIYGCERLSSWDLLKAVAIAMEHCNPFSFKLLLRPLSSLSFLRHLEIVIPFKSSNMNSMDNGKTKNLTTLKLSCRNFRGCWVHYFSQKYPNIRTLILDLNSNSEDIKDFMCMQKSLFYTSLKFYDLERASITITMLCTVQKTVFWHHTLFVISQSTM